ncbi:MAG: hypothetical protein ACFB2W_00890 [Leptolyngbyaceae cyanobacterium]|mgnify:CR=1 FL=1
MNKVALSDWVKAQIKEQTCAALGRHIGVASQTIGDWRDQKFKSLRHENVLALSVYREESVSETYHWLGLPVPSGPVVSLHEKVAALELAIEQIREKLAA